MVAKPADFFIRRTGALFFHIDWVQKWKVPVMDYMAEVLGWTPEQRSQYAKELETYLYDAVVPEDAQSLPRGKEHKEII
ncbi:Aerobic glycerol-3-phosphate dehydrogenase [compost metagenome]